MICQRYFTRMQLSTAILAGLSAIALALILSAPATATTPADSFTVGISEKQGGLEDLSDDMHQFLMWDLGFDRIKDRNMPYLEIKNDASSQDPITAFHLTIGDTRFNFDCSVLHACAMLGKSTPDVDLASAISNGGDQLDLTFGNGGLQPGEVVRFKIALGIDSAYQNDPKYFVHPDFRTVLFQMNGHSFYPALASQSTDPMANNAEVTVNFGSGIGALTAGPTPLHDYTVTGDAALYYNGIFRHYGTMESVDRFDLAGSAGAVPEPSTIALAAVGMFTGLVTVAYKRRRS